MRAKPNPEAIMAKIAHARRHHHPVEHLRVRLVEARTGQLRRELAADGIRVRRPRRISTRGL